MKSFTRQAVEMWTTLVLAVALILGVFAYMEPLALRAQESVSITITQQITGETSFTADPGNVSMDTAIGGVSGGTSNGTTSFTVQSNNPSGYEVTLNFSTTTNMQLNGGGGQIPNYVEDTPGVPDYGFGPNSTGGAAQFGFSVFSTTSSIVAPNFRDNSGGAGNACGTGSDNLYRQCWSSGSTTAVRILTRGAATSGTGDAGHVLFRVHVPANPSPAVPTGFYTATATLSVSEL